MDIDKLLNRDYYKKLNIKKDELSNNSISQLNNIFLNLPFKSYTYKSKLLSLLILYDIDSDWIEIIYKSNNFKRDTCSKEFFVSLFGDKLGNMMFEDRRSGVKFNKDSFIKKHGSIGKMKYDAFCESRKTNSITHYIKKYEDDAEYKWLESKLKHKRTYIIHTKKEKIERHYLHLLNDMVMI